MKQFFAALVCGTALAAASVTTSVAQAQTPSAVSLATAEDTVSYALGVALAGSVVESFTRMPLEGVDFTKLTEVFAPAAVNPNYLTYVEKDLGKLDGGLIKEAMIIALGTGDMAISPTEAQDILMNRAESYKAQREAAEKAEAEQNAKEGKEFMAANGKKRGVMTTPSGLQYKVLKKGKGAQMAEGDRVKVRYRGTTLSGQVFDEQTEPIEFDPARLIKGWQEALKLMKVGDKWQIWVPADLGYGEQGAGEMIGANATLVFEMEMVEVVK